MQTIIEVGILIALITQTTAFIVRSKALLKVFSEFEWPESAVSEPEGLDQVQADLANLTLAVAEGIERVDRSERRIRSVVKSAKRRFEAAGFDDPGLEAEASTLPRLDEIERAEERLPDLQPHVGVDNSGSAAWKVVPGRVG